MNTVFAVLSLVAVASVSALPFTLDFHHKAAFVHPAGVVHEGHKLRFLHLMPKAVHAGDFVDGFACGGKEHAFLKLTAGHKLVELVGLADCALWHAVHLTAWDGTGLVHKAHAFEKATAGAAFGEVAVADLAALVDFVHGKLGVEHKGLFGKLVAAGVPAHLLVLKLHAKFGL